MILSVTGPRPIRLGGYFPSIIRRLDDFARVQIEKEHMVYDRPGMPPDSRLTVLTGMALGWDQSIARACEFWNVPFVAAIPFSGQEGMWPVLAQREYRRLLGSAERVVVVSEGGFSPAKMRTRNRWMVDGSGRLLALLGKWETGGTWDCVKYAERVGRDTRNCWREWETFR